MQCLFFLVHAEPGGKPHPHRAKSGLARAFPAHPRAREPDAHIVTRALRKPNDNRQTCRAQAIDFRDHANILAPSNAGSN